MLLDLIFRRIRSERAKRPTLAVRIVVARLFLALLLLLAVATTLGERHHLESLAGNCQSAGLAYPVIRLVHAPERVIDFVNAVALALGKNHRHVLLEFLRRQVAAVHRAVSAG